MGADRKCKSKNDMNYERACDFSIRDCKSLRRD